MLDTSGKMIMGGIYQYRCVKRSDYLRNHFALTIKQTWYPTYFQDCSS